MGIGKSIESYGIYHYYSADINVFIKKLAELTHSNFTVTLLDVDCDAVYTDKLFHFDKPQTLYLTILESEYNIQNTKRTLPTYSVKFPITYDYESELEIEFNPNQVSSIVFLTFEHLWKAFIDVLRFETRFQEIPRHQIVERYQTLRREYSRVLKMLEIDSLLLVTHAYYNIESLTDPESYNSMEFQNITDEAKRIDGFNTFDFEEILLAESKNQLPENFVILDELKIALIDNMTKF
jgi:hypothetical protein